MMVLCWRLNVLQQGQICFTRHLYGAQYIYIGKILRIHIFNISSIIHLNRNLMMSIRAPSRHKIAKLADRKSKMAVTAAILKINFRHLFPNLWSFWAEICSVATGWLLNWNKLKLCRSKIQDGRNGSSQLNKMTTRAKNRNSSNDISSLASGQILKYLHKKVFLQWLSKPLKTSPPQPVSQFQSNFTEVFLLWLFTKIGKIVRSAIQNGHQS